MLPPWVAFTAMPQGPRNLAIAFGAESLTHYGGAYLLHRFFSWIGFKNALAMDVRLVQRNNRYSVGEMLLALLYPMILDWNGSKRISCCDRTACSNTSRGSMLSESVYAAAILAAGGTDGTATTARLA